MLVVGMAFLGYPCSCAVALEMDATWGNSFPRLSMFMCACVGSGCYVGVVVMGNIFAGYWICQLLYYISGLRKSFLVHALLLLVGSAQG